MPTLKSTEEIALMRQAGKIVNRCLREIEKALKPNITGEEIDELAKATIESLGGKPSFRGYGGYPASICISINDEVAHGIPNTRSLKEGDIVSIDIGVIYNGYQADAAATFGIGQPASLAAALMSSGAAGGSWARSPTSRVLSRSRSPSTARLASA